MSLPGYDAWKTREPEPDWCPCEVCGLPLRNDGNLFLYCERCDAPEPFDAADYEAWAKEQP